MTFSATSPTDLAIDLHGVGKRYLQHRHGDDILARRLLTPWRWGGSRAEHWALRDVDFSVRAGETVGVIGRNGSGKTTLLRLLSGVSAPSAGRLRVAGSIAPLIGVGVGFSPELTGRENVFVNGQLLGMTEPEVRRQFDAIVEFSEIEDFIDTPVKYYSSGMFLRLGFAVAIHANPEVLLVDEILAVGDIAFQLKCLERMRQVQASGTTIVVVTHNLHSLDRMAPRTMVLSRGRVVFDGRTEDALAAYQRVMQDESTDAPDSAQQLQEAIDGAYAGGARLSVELRDEDGRPAQSFATGGRMQVALQADFDRDVQDPLIGLLVRPERGDVPAYWTHSFPGVNGETYGPQRAMMAEIDLAMRLLGGGYTVTVAVRDGDGDLVLAESSPLPFYVTSHHREAGGLVDLEADIRIEGRSLAAPVRSRLGAMG
jgi:ABC-type polysaccharide/polyol phosphate transport system ATPase subunit